MPARGAATPEDALGGKVCALASQAYERDYLDTAAALERYTPEQLTSFAAAGPGLEGEDFADAAASGSSDGVLPGAGLPVGVVHAAARAGAGSVAPSPVMPRGQLQFELQFTCVQHRPLRYTPYRDLHRWTLVDVRKRRAADS